MLQQDFPQRPTNDKRGNASCSCCAERSVDSCGRWAVNCCYRAEVWIMFREREMGMLCTKSAAAAEWSAIWMNLNYPFCCTYNCIALTISHRKWLSSSSYVELYSVVLNSVWIKAPCNAVRLRKRPIVSPRRAHAYKIVTAYVSLKK